MIRSGNLDHKWTILERTEAGSTFSDSGGASYTAIGTDPVVWGSWEPMKGAERWAAQQTVATAVARVRMRYRSDLTSRHRLQSAVHGEFEIIGEPEHRPREGETVVHVARVIGD